MDNMTVAELISIIKTIIYIAGISVLNNLDYYIKEKLHIKYYIRYMDDFILIHYDKKYLEYCKEKLKKN